MSHFFEKWNQWAVLWICEPPFQSVSEDPLAQSQGSVSTQHRERGPALPGQRAGVSTLLCPPHTATRGLLQVRSLTSSPATYYIIAMTT